MSAIGGPAKTISIAGRDFACTADCNINMTLGGYSNEHQPNGTKSARIIKKRVCAKLEGVSVEIDLAREDMEFLNDVNNGAEDVDVVVEYVDGTFYAGALGVEGELAYAAESASASFDMAGGGELKQM